MKLCPLTSAHWPQAWALYGEAQASARASLPTEAPAWPEWDWAHLPHSRLAAVEAGAGKDGPLLGWAALSPLSHRALTRGVAEVSLFVAEAARGRGMARQLLEALVTDSEAYGIWTLQVGLLSDDTTGYSIYTGAGFREVGRRERFALVWGKWHDVLLLERRSGQVG